MVSEPASVLSAVRRLHERLERVSERLREDDAFDEPSFKRAFRAEVEPGRSSDPFFSGSYPSEPTTVASEQVDGNARLSDEGGETLTTEGDQHSSPPEGGAKPERCQVCSELAEELVAYRHGRVCKTCRDILP